MKYPILALTAATVLGATAFAGETYTPATTKNVVAQKMTLSPYPDREWTVDLFGTYAFTESTNERILGDHAFGGGLAVNYFFLKQVGLGIEGQALRSQIEDRGNGDGDDSEVLGTVALNLFYRCPIGNSGWAPYIYVGGGVVFNTDNTDFGDVVDDVIDENDDQDFGGNNLGSNNNGNDDDALIEGHAGVGVEYRISRHFGVFTDGRWTVVENSKNNFPSVRTGVRFAF